MEHIINNMVNDQELAKLILDSVNKLNNLHHLLLKGGTSFWDGDKYVYSFIFKDTSDIATLEMPVYKMITEEAMQFRSRQDNRVSRLYEFAYYISDETPQNITISDITNSLINITFTIS